MPEISRFLGIVITMFYNDHSPPHFHALYGNNAVTVSIRDESVTGEFPNRLGIGTTTKTSEANCATGVTHD